MPQLHKVKPHGILGFLHAVEKLQVFLGKKNLARAPAALDEMTVLKSNFRHGRQ
jgi:hypothetical protein